MIKREFIEVNQLEKITLEDSLNYMEWHGDSKVDCVIVAPRLTEQDIVKPYLDKLKKQIEQNVERYCLSRESHGMGKVDWNEYLITESKVIELIDNLLSEQERIRMMEQSNLCSQCAHYIGAREQCHDCVWDERPRPWADDTVLLYDRFEERENND